jgi:hypothetical protein
MYEFNRIEKNPFE